MNHDHRVLWRSSADGSTTMCVMVSCCAGAELQVVRSTAEGDEEIILRELYPDRDSLYERARELCSTMAPSLSLEP
jgi:hypothetical protein